MVFGDVRTLSSIQHEKIKEIDNYYQVVAIELRSKCGLDCLISSMIPIHRHDHQAELVEYFKLENDIDRLHDVVTLTFGIIGRLSDGEVALNMLNTRFKDNTVGYQFVNDELVRMDSEILHEETVVPALRLLNKAGYESAEGEYLAAHAYYRKGEYESAMTDALKSLESTLKIICTNKGWTYTAKDTASKLLEICFDNELIPNFLQSHFTALRAVLESGVPTVRNKQAGHGAGPSVRSVPDYLASFVVHSAAAAIVLLIEAAES